ncbi:12663_t:CDS:2 [Funneliformis caledonium]|uniref:12663_t:CDS:1 n=1 Tax=Funneliformis caledonium TaxID=1117310 RepID=A0A9N8V430_9GLOM|nr:12663_t:CDS:2 [Funneliformis caledonium]
MLKIYSILPPPINKFAGFILYGLLSVALIALAQEDTIAGNCMVPLEPVPVENKQITIGYVQLFDTSQQKRPTIPWSYYDFINVIAYPQDRGGDWNDIFRPKDVSKLKLIDDLVRDKANSSTKILLSIRGYDVRQQIDGDYQKIITESIDTIKHHGLDGIDIEYPGMRGSLCKEPDFIWDKENDGKFINFLRNLRMELNGMEGPKKILMLTVAPDDNSYRSYPNSPLNLFRTAYESWSITGGIDSKKIIMGVDFGNTIQMIVDNVKAIEKSQTVNFTNNGVFDINRLGLEAQTKRIKYPCGDDVNDINQMKLYSWAWKYLSNSTLDPKSGYCNIINNNSQLNWTRNFGQVDESKTPWLYSAISPGITPNNYLYVSYEDFVSLSLKLEFAKNNSVGGISISDVTFDDDNLLNFMQPIRSKSAVGSSSPSNGSDNGNSKSNPNNNVGMKKGIITGSIVGSVLGLFLLVSCAYWYRQKTLRKSEVDINPELSSNRIVSSTTVIQSDRRIIDHLIIE